MVPRARNGTLAMAPKKKNSRKTGPVQPPAAPAARAADAEENIRNEMVQASSWRRCRASHRSKVDMAKARATSAAPTAAAVWTFTPGQPTTRFDDFVRHFTRSYHEGMATA